MCVGSKERGRSSAAKWEGWREMAEKSACTEGEGKGCWVLVET